MPEVRLRPLTFDDLPFLTEVRNHPITLPFLHDNRGFSLEDARHWFSRSQPEWLIILHQGQRVGYVRTSDKDRDRLSIKVGADVHPDYRRRGIATAAYRQLFQQLRQEGWHRIWLEVLSTNHGAIALYEKLGFRREGQIVNAVKRDGCWVDSIAMSLNVDPLTGVNVKVIATYFGERRHHPANARRTFDLLRFLLECEQNVSAGCPADTIIVHNRVNPPSAPDAAFWFDRCEAELQHADGQKTPQGIIRVFTRDNVGLSFGAFNYAFSRFVMEYDHWLFTEDDQVMIRDGYFAQGIRQLEDDGQVGFVALVGVSKCHHPPHAHGGVGISSRQILREVKSANPCERHPEGHLPYHVGLGYDKQELLGEVRFTNAIHNLGYNLVDHKWEDICVSWEDTQRRTPRMIPWSPSMRVTK